MNQYAPFVRILLRYFAASVGGMAWVADDQDLVMVGCVLLAAVVELAYGYARKRGGAM